MACAGDVKRHIDKNIAELVHLESYICYGFTPAALAATMPLAQTPNFCDFTFYYESVYPFTCYPFPVVLKQGTTHLTLARNY